MIKSEIEEYEDCLITTDWVKKSNLLINQIGARSSLLAEKVFLYSLTVIEKRGPGFIPTVDEVWYGNIDITKKGNDGAFIEGAVFRIYEWNGKKYVKTNDTIKTNSNGKEIGRAHV